MKPPSAAKSLLALAGFVAAAAGAASFGAQFSAKKSKAWYRGLNKPGFTPPTKFSPSYGLLFMPLWHGRAGEFGARGHRFAAASA